MEGEEEMRRRATDYLGKIFQPSHSKERLLNPDYITVRVY